MATRRVLGYYGPSGLVVGGGSPGTALADGLPAGWDRLHGTAVYKDSKAALPYLDAIEDYKVRDADIHRQIDVAWKLYKHEGVVGSAVDVLVEFATTPLMVEGPDAEAVDLVRAWEEALNAENENCPPGILAFAEAFYLSWFVPGNVFPLATAQRWSWRGRPVEAPLLWTLLDPKNVAIPAESLTLAGRTLLYTVPAGLRALVRKASRGGTLTPEQREMLEQIPGDLRTAIDKKGQIDLRPFGVRHYRRKGPPHEVWGIPYVLRAVPAVAALKRLQALDASTIEGLINQIVIFCIGDFTQAASLHPARQSRFAAMVADPTPSLYGVWGPDLRIETVRPAPEALNIGPRHQAATEAIFDAMGVPVHLLSGRFDLPPQTVYAAATALMERLEQPREVLLGALRRQVATLLAAAHIAEEKWPVLSWTALNLNDPQVLRARIMAAREHGMYSLQTSLENLGSDIRVERWRRRREQASGDEETFAPPPFPSATRGTPGPGMPPRSAPEPPPEKRPRSETAASAPADLGPLFARQWEALAGDWAQRSRSPKHGPAREEGERVARARLEAMRGAAWSELTARIGQRPDRDDAFVRRWESWWHAQAHTLRDEAAAILAATWSEGPRGTAHKRAAGRLRAMASRIADLAREAPQRAALVGQLIGARRTGGVHARGPATGRCPHCAGLGPHIALEALYDLRVETPCRCPWEFVEEGE